MILLSMHEVCERLGVSRQTILKWRKAGKFPEPTKTIGKVCLFNADEVARPPKAQPKPRTSYMRSYYAKNKERIKARVQAWREAHRK